MIDKIRTKKQYEQVMTLIENYITKATEKGGFKSLSKKENEELKNLSVLAEQYEDEVLKIMPLPVTVENVVSIKMQELNITQIKLAEMLNVGTAKLSQILNGKRKPDVPFLKAVHEKLGVDGNFILENV
ncbi:MAG: helix-turn-helix transcriptional regulator [Bacteroidetes bacterium]|nr:helix-turn-helix transcriptional regulator [Bacteroidota bacterium]